MYYYLKDEKGNIKQFCECSSNVPAFLEDWLKTDRKIIALSNGNLAFDDEVDHIKEAIEAERKAQEDAAQEEAEALKPTTDDLAEALDILTEIVLGGSSNG